MLMLMLMLASLVRTGLYGFLENQDQGSRTEDRGSRTEDRGSRIKDQGPRIEDQLYKTSGTQSAVQATAGNTPMVSANRYMLAL